VVSSLKALHSTIGLFVLVPATLPAIKKDIGDIIGKDIDKILVIKKIFPTMGKPIISFLCAADS